MINLKSGMTSSIALRFDKASDIYLFELKSIQERETYLFTAENLSPTDRFFEFKIFEVSGTIEEIALTASIPKIKLNWQGSYNYKIYGVEDYNLEVNDNILDIGKLIFKKNINYNLIPFDVGDDDIFGIFGPEEDDVREWILKTGLWNDGGFWDDDEVWNDG
jgi:hypothetical protein